MCCAMHYLSKHFTNEYNEEMPFPLYTEVEVGGGTETNIEESAQQIRNKLMVVILNE